VINLPSINKNAYLSIHLKPDSLSAHLAFTHYDIGRSYILKDSMWLDRDHDFDDLKSSEFWKSYLEGLEKAFGWEIFSDYGQIRPLEGENIGVGGVRIYVSKELKDQEVLNSLREFSKDVQVVLNKSTVKEKRLTGLLEKENLLDIVHVNLSLRDFSVDRVWSEEKGK
jgi:hypothetical protein